MNTCQQADVRNMYGVVSEAVQFISGSAKRLHVYTTQKTNKALALKKFCATRWSSHEDTLGTFILNIETAVETLEPINTFIQKKKKKKTFNNK